MRQQSRWIGARALVIGVVCLAAASSGAQSVDELPGTGIHRLTPAELVQLVALRNAEALSAELQTRVADRLLDSEQALYEPVVFSTGRQEMVDRPRNQDDPLQSPFFGAQEDLEEEIASLSLGLRQLLPTGAEGQVRYQWVERISSALDDNQEYTGNAVISLRQPLMRNRGRAATEADLRVVELEREIDVLRYRARLLESSGDAVNGYWQLYRSLQGLVIRRESLDTVRQLLEDVRRRAEGGFAPRTDLLEARIAVTSRQADVTRAVRLVDEAQSRLRTLLDVEVSGEMTLDFAPGTRPSLRLDESWTLAQRIEEARRVWPDLRIAALRERQEQVRLGLAENQTMPALDLEVGFNWNSIGSDDGNSYSGALSLFNGSRYSHRNGWYAGVDFEMPLGNGEARGRAGAQAFRLQQARLETASLANSLGHDIGTRWRQVRSALEEAEQLAEDARLREELLEAERAQYALGRVRLSEVLDREEELNESRQRLLDATTRFELARLALLIADGSLLDAYGVEVSLEP